MIMIGTHRFLSMSELPQHHPLPPDSCPMLLQCLHIIMMVMVMVVMLLLLLLLMMMIKRVHLGEGREPDILISKSFFILACFIYSIKPRVNYCIGGNPHKQLMMVNWRMTVVREEEGKRLMQNDMRRKRWMR